MVASELRGAQWYHRHSSNKFNIGRLRSVRPPVLQDFANYAIHAFIGCFIDSCVEKCSSSWIQFCWTSFQNYECEWGCSRDITSTGDVSITLESLALIPYTTSINKHSDQNKHSLEDNQFRSALQRRRFVLSTDPPLWRWQGRSLMNAIPGNICFNSVITVATNFRSSHCAVNVEEQNEINMRVTSMLLPSRICFPAETPMRTCCNDQYRSKSNGKG
jgi:hypothetical protein